MNRTHVGTEHEGGPKRRVSDRRQGLGRRIVRDRRRETILVAVERRSGTERRSAIPRRSGLDRRADQGGSQRGYGY